MGDQEEDLYMDWAVGGADDQESVAPMAARSRCRVRPRARGGAGAAIGTGLGRSFANTTERHCRFAGLPHEGAERALEQLAERKAMRGGDRCELLLHAR